MIKQILHVEPIFKDRIWGGTTIKTRFHAETEVDRIGEMWCVSAMKGNGDNILTEIGLTLSEAYKTIPEWFGCSSDSFPIRCTLIDPVENVSVQVHPDDNYARVYSNSKGKNEAWYVIDVGIDNSTQLGHKAKSREEFSKLAKSKRWDELLTYIQLKSGDFIDVPCGTVHAIGKNTVVFEIANNVDITYRIYDYDRIDVKTGNRRDIHLEAALSVINFTNIENKIVNPEPVSVDGCLISTFIDEAGKYTLLKVEVSTVGEFDYSHFYFITIIEGEGKVNGIQVRQGDTLFVPKAFGPIIIINSIKALISSYHD